MTSAEDPSWDAEVGCLAGPGREPEVEKFLRSLPGGYRPLTSPAEALDDMAVVEDLDAVPLQTGRPLTAGDPGSSTMGARYRLAVRPGHDPSCSFRIRRFGREGVELSSILPLLESFGLVVVESVPMRLGGDPPDGVGLHIDDIGLRAHAPHGPETLRFVPEVHGARLVEAIEASVRGDSDVDSLNRLVTAAGLDWRQVLVLRAYLRYWRQSGVTLSWDQMSEPLAVHPDVTRALIGYFESRFAPSPPARPVAEGSAAGPDSDRAVSARRLVLAQMDLVTSLEEDRVLRSVLTLIDATWRTNFFAMGGRGPGREVLTPLALKMSSHLVPDLPSPRPLVDTFVHGPTVEGVHLRAGLIARGGIRWSERPADFRTEVLDLAFAQVKKNAIIVPTGAKGGFVCRAANPGPDEVRAAYAQFVTALLDVTDNLVGGRCVTPTGVVAADGDDPYLVVAADKGTATFSDLANSISEAQGFWLGDAFASGGSRGYDHKAMGITARGAWVAVRRHFRELDLDVNTDPVTVVGVGDMSGDVFGNGMLQSRSLRLLAAFDHRHVFIDPDPDPAGSFEERRRLAHLERSSWADYRSDRISAGGGVWSLHDKVIPLSPPARRVLGVEEDSLRPPEVVSAILRAPVDLLWFGGIGTFVKAPDEADSEVGDRANDAVRVTSDRIRARVVAEGANLGVTQRARIRYSRRGGRINADFIDNAAGVATSDREVNLKILLALAGERGRLDAQDRDGYLRAARDEVADGVLRQVDHSVAALNRAAADSDRYLDAYQSLIDDLEAAGRFDRRVEVLPDAEEFDRRRQAGAGLIRPELATVLTYAKTELVAAVEGAGWSRDPYFLDSVTPYFPQAIRDDFGDLIAEHRLYRQLVATDIAGEVVDQMGIIWAHDLAAELGCSLDQVAAAFWVARQVTASGALWERLEGLAADPSAGVGASAEAALHRVVAEAVGRLARRYLNRPGPFEPVVVARRDQGRLEATQGVALEVPLPGWPGTPELDLAGERADAFLEAPISVARLEAVEIADDAGMSADQAVVAAAVARRIVDTTGLDALLESVRVVLDGVTPAGRLRVWQARALLDDLDDWRRRAATAVLITASDGDPLRCVDEWLGRHAEELARASAMVAVTGAADDRLAAAALALRRLNRVLN